MILAGEKTTPGTVKLIKADPDGTANELIIVERANY